MSYINTNLDNYKQNLHTHTTFCDGKNTPEELVCEAIARGFDSLGFSIHSFMRKQTVDAEKLSAYKAEILRVKEKYKDSLAVYLGIEYEPWTDFPADDFDYTIAAVHYLPTPDGYRTFDVGLEGTLAYIDNYFGGDAMRFAGAYYETLAALPEHGSFDILAHLDLVTKNNEAHRFLDTESAEYNNYVLGAIDALAGKIPLFEVNTGAIARGYKSEPYPSKKILRELKARGFGAVITSDCHNKDYLDCFFDGARDYLAEAGFKSRFILTDDGFKEIAL